MRRCQPYATASIRGRIGGRLASLRASCFAPESNGGCVAPSSGIADVRTSDRFLLNSELYCSRA
eukprot:6368896-Alexandrium_andersonii.AAC.1